MPGSSTAPVVQLLRLSGFPLLRQLLLEESLFRSHPGNWFVINDGVPDPTIVLGISGKPEELINLREASTANIPLLRRFTGGGTVIVDSNSIMTSIIMHGPTAVPDVPCYPRPIMHWTEGVFGNYLKQYNKDFSLRENDYALGQKKFGGNAQAISKDRWLHHTSFLWDYEQHRMELLKHPPRAPEYRAGRDHSEFIVPLKQVFKGVVERTELVDGLAMCLEMEGFIVKEGRLEEAEDAAEKNSLIGSKLLDINDYL
ncbi:hypothetical protein Ndes2526B_g09084 [Nannochloris sp. 'desiccata']|nr:hypothetical protein KSW81_001368 [Chlorella desiccata (nom. nud.)]KAH7616978.1 putative lipoate-protein ligase A [Chlorella desiccata (nom. nud.)]